LVLEWISNGKLKLLGIIKRIMPDACLEGWYYQKDYARCMPGGESFLDIRARFVPFVQELVEAYRYSNETVVLVSHGGVFYAMLPEVLTNVSWPEMQTRKFSNTGYVVAELQPDATLMCIDWKSEISA